MVTVRIMLENQENCTLYLVLQIIHRFVFCSLPCNFEVFDKTLLILFCRHILAVLSMWRISDYAGKSCNPFDEAKNVRFISFLQSVLEFTVW